MELETRIAGIPCIVRLTHYRVTPPNRMADSSDDYYGDEECEYEVCDRRGRPAPWLHRKLSAADDCRIAGEFADAMSNDNWA